MPRLHDYSGEFRPELRLSDFSPATLARLARLYQKLYVALDGFWYLTVKERLGNKEALACDIQAWERVCRYEMSKIRGGLKIEGDDVAALMKALQFCPWFQLMECRMEVRDGSYGRFTVSYCPTLAALEKEGEGRESEICTLVEPRILKAYAACFNPEIEVGCLKAPPRVAQDDICCQWEFRLNSGR
ncbi:MAG: hypothetical protein JW790_01200 [Dehalococcoidales bacterium]|nr:hypothetical protein [Dehalococcoidales bacterium]